MQVGIEPLYPLNRKVERGRREFPEGTTVRDILEALGFSPREIGEMRVAIEGSLVDMETVPGEGSVLVLMATLAGG